jgi:hypothetical protein
LRVFVCKLRLHFPDSKHLRGFACHEIFGNIWPTPPQLYMLATALKKTSAPVRLINRNNDQGPVVSKAFNSLTTV